MNPDTDPAATAAPAKAGDGRARILQAALEEFATHGFEGASTTVIARRSGVTQPLIHYHFGSKEGLWRATVNDLFERLRGEFLAIIQRQPPVRGQARTTFLALLREFVRFCGRHPQFPRLLYLELPVPSTRSAWLIEIWGKPTVEKLSELHPSFARLVGLQDFPTAQVVVAITGAAGTLFALGDFVRDTWGTDPADQAVIERHAELVATLFDRGLFSTPGPVSTPAAS